eukprot:TRINITY_DN1748_c1_g2_i1.p1 TRINITY_DN1748_c1_g2~~TRINITY_DN1748_c1_g2_i1.p1  ORF type:complete len:550 (+),score=112.52 TRINITY_DN1748_c1_g2_i1:61-1710(+)
MGQLLPGGIEESDSSDSRSVGESDVMAPKRLRSFSTPCVPALQCSAAAPPVAARSFAVPPQLSAATTARRSSAQTEGSSRRRPGPSPNQSARKRSESLRFATPSPQPLRVSATHCAVSARDSSHKTSAAPRHAGVCRRSLAMSTLQSVRSRAAKEAEQEAAAPAARFEPLDCDSTESQTVISAFLEDGGFDAPAGLHVSRVSNPALTRRFLAAAQEARSQGGRGVVAVFHGVTGSAPTQHVLSEITRRGLDPVRCKSALFGRGAYVATSGQKAKMYAMNSKYEYLPNGEVRERHSLPVQVLVLLLALRSTAEIGTHGKEHADVTSDSVAVPTQYCIPPRQADALLITHVIEVEEERHVATARGLPASACRSQTWSHPSLQRKQSAASAATRPAPKAPAASVRSSSTCVPQPPCGRTIRARYGSTSGDPDRLPARRSSASQSRRPAPSPSLATSVVVAAAAVAAAAGRRQQQPARCGDYCSVVPAVSFRVPVEAARKVADAAAPAKQQSQPQSTRRQSPVRRIRKSGSAKCRSMSGRSADVPRRPVTVEF